MHEKELKIKLASEDDYLATRDHLPGFQQEVEQINIYFDTPDQHYLLQGVMIRVRHANERYILTVKARAAADQGYFTAYEWEKEIAHGMANSIETSGRLPQEIFSDLPEHFDMVINGENLVEVGRTKNLRRIYHAGGFTIELDMFHITADTQDYEVEVETDNPDDARAWLHHFFSRHNVHHEVQKLTKYKRFLQGRIKK